MPAGKKDIIAGHSPALPWTKHFRENAYGKYMDMWYTIRSIPRGKLIISEEAEDEIIYCKTWRDGME